MIVQIIDYLKDRPKMVRFYSYLGIAIILIWSTVSVDKHHAHTWMEMHVPIFWSLFGLASCVVLIYFARWFGKSGIMTREDYYDK